MSDLTVPPANVTLRDLWFRWVLATTIGITLGLFAAKVALDYRDYLWILALCVIPIALGSPLGIMQWLVLRSQISWGWILATILGVNLGFFLTFGIFDLPDIPFFLLAVLGFAVFGFLVGGMQWLMLQARFLKAKSWIWVNTLGGAIVGVIVSLADAAGIMNANNILIGIILAVIAGAVFGGITGMALIRLLQHPIAVNHPLNLQQDLSISRSEAINGTEKIIELDGRRLKVTVPAGITEGTKLRLKGRGISRVVKGENISGDLYLKILIKNDEIESGN